MLTGTMTMTKETSYWSRQESAQLQFTEGKHSLESTGQKPSGSWDWNPALAKLQRSPGSYGPSGKGLQERDLKGMLGSPSRNSLYKVREGGSTGMWLRVQPEDSLLSFLVISGDLAISQG